MCSESSPVLEPELGDPALFFETAPPAAPRFARVLHKRIRTGD
jgi:hypothetical protein